MTCFWPRRNREGGEAKRQRKEEPKTGKKKNQVKKPAASTETTKWSKCRRIVTNGTRESVGHLVKPDEVLQALGTKTMKGHVPKKKA